MSFDIKGGTTNYWSPGNAYTKCE